jgi:putative radical SAM enzyme (TIGR03279 family)
VSFPIVTQLTAESPAALAGVLVGDEIQKINGITPRDVIEWNTMSTEADVFLEVVRGGIRLDIDVDKLEGERLGVEVESPIFDQVRTCDNHCEFCFIYQLPPGLRKALYVKDDDFRLSFLYGNFTTLTRFTESDLERITLERLSPLYVSIHATDPAVRTRMLRNRRGATSLRWLRALLDHGIEVHGQVVVCPGLNDGAVLADTLAGLYQDFSDLTTVAVVPLGVSQYTTEPAMRAHTRDEACRVVALVEDWQTRFVAKTNRRVVYAADEYYVLAEQAFPPRSSYDDFSQIENGIGMARAFANEFFEGELLGGGTHGGFFAWVDGAPAEGYRAPRLSRDLNDALAKSQRDLAKPITLITGTYGRQVLEPMLIEANVVDVELLEVANDFFGGNIGVTGLLAGVDVSRALSTCDDSRRYLLPDVCLSNDRFIDGVHVNELPIKVEVVETSGVALRDIFRACTSQVAVP